MAGFFTDIEKESGGNKYFRQVLYTGPNSQLVVMSLQPGEDIGVERHEKTDQFIRVEEGEGLAILDGKEYRLESGSAIVVPAGSLHNIINSSKSATMKLYTVFSPPELPEGTIHRTKAEAKASENK